MERPQQPPLECKKSFEVEEPLDVNTPDLLVSRNLSVFYLLTFIFWFNQPKSSECNLYSLCYYINVLLRYYYSYTLLSVLLLVWLDSKWVESDLPAYYQSPTGGMKEKKVTCMFIPDGQVSLNAKIDRRGFCEGEDICINAKFENTCSRIVVPKAAIIAKHTYQANGRTKIFRQKLSSVRGNHIISGMCDAWQGKTIRVPKIKPSMLGCNIIRVEYALMVCFLLCGHLARDVKCLSPSSMVNIKHC